MGGDDQERGGTRSLRKGLEGQDLKTKEHRGQRERASVPNNRQNRGNVSTWLSYGSRRDEPQYLGCGPCTIRGPDRSLWVEQGSSPAQCEWDPREDSPDRITNCTSSPIYK